MPFSNPNPWTSPGAQYFKWSPPRELFCLALLWWTPPLKTYAMEEKVPGPMNWRRERRKTKTNLYSLEWQMCWKTWKVDMYKWKLVSLRPWVSSHARRWMLAIAVQLCHSSSFTMNWCLLSRLQEGQCFLTGHRLSSLLRSLLQQAQMSSVFSQKSTRS